MPPQKPKSPFSDEVSQVGTDPNALYTGGGSQMFSNENLNRENRTKKKLEAKRAEQSSQLIPVANDLLEMLAEKKSSNADIRSVLKRIRGTDAGKQLTEAEIHQIAVQAEAREMNIALIEEIERWIRSRLRQNQ